MEFNDIKIEKSKDLKMHKPKLLVLGHARHGKDTVCEILRDQYGFKFMSSSLFCAEKVVYPILAPKYGYATLGDCYEDRVNHRGEWFNLIYAHNKDDPARLGREIFAEYDIYCGLRNIAEYEYQDAEGVFDVCVWVDASERMPPESKDSCTVHQGLADVIIDNNRSLEYLRTQVAAFVKTLDLN